MCFFDVSDVDMLAIKLDNIFLGKQKLFVNLPRFQRPQQDVMGFSKPSELGLEFQKE